MPETIALIFVLNDGVNALLLETKLRLLT